MGITIDLDRQRIEDYFKKLDDIMASELRRAFKYLGEQAVIDIRDRTADQSWKDQTGNLRSSTGYALYETGAKVFSSAFANVVGQKPKPRGVSGRREGKQLVEDLVNVYPQSFALVLMAAMRYASEVEARGRDVLKGPMGQLKLNFETIISKAVDKAILRINKLKL